MSRTIDIDALWDDEASVWTAVSRDLPGLVAEASTWAALIEEVRALVPELLELAGKAHEELTLRFRAETRVDVAAA